MHMLHKAGDPQRMQCNSYKFAAHLLVFTLFYIYLFCQWLQFTLLYRHLCLFIQNQQYGSTSSFCYGRCGSDLQKQLQAIGRYRQDHPGTQQLCWWSHWHFCWSQSETSTGIVWVNRMESVLEYLVVNMYLSYDQ